MSYQFSPIKESPVGVEVKCRSSVGGLAFLSKGYYVDVPGDNDQCVPDLLSVISTEVDGASSEKHRNEIFKDLMQEIIGYAKSQGFISKIATIPDSKLDHAILSSLGFRLDDSLSKKYGDYMYVLRI
jgi:hypothetical protein